MKESIALTPSASMASSLMQEVYMRRALRVALSSTVSFGGDDVRRSENSERIIKQR
jgi:hypothetical protein